MTHRTKLILPLLLACLAPSLGLAQETRSPVTAGPYPVTGNVPALCAFGTIAGATGRFDLNVLIDTTTGFLRTDLAPPSRTITGSWCNARSTLNVVGTRMSAQGFTTTPPTGFSTGVDYTASASSWTPSPAVYATGVTTAQATATQSQTAPNASNIVLTLSTFATQGGPTLRPVADPNYAGTVTLTLTPTF
jgi:hypothetical protein